MKILIVEDAIDIQIILTQILESNNYEVICASDGLEALKVLQSETVLPNLILLDLMMPNMNGYEFRQEQKKNPAIAQIPVVVMTAGGDLQSKNLDLDAKAYLRKPFPSIDTILETVGTFAA